MQDLKDDEDVDSISQKVFNKVSMNFDNKFSNSRIPTYNLNALFSDIFIS